MRTLTALWPEAVRHVREGTGEDVAAQLALTLPHTYLLLSVQSRRMRKLPRLNCWDGEEMVSGWRCLLCTVGSMQAPLTGAKEEPQAEGPGKWAIQGEQDSARKQRKSPVT